MELWFRRAKRNWLERIIAWRTIGPYSHVEAVLGPWAWSAVPGQGVRRIPLNELNPADFDKIRVSRLDERAVEDWFLEHEGETYDVVGLLELAAGKPSSDPRAWYCSECCCQAMKSGGAFPSIPSAGVHPFMLWAMALAREDTLKEVSL
jgi:hypothetical protein